MVINITGKLVIDYRTREWCKLPYPGHSTGCPNYGIHKECPPKVAIITDVFDLSKDHFLIIEPFDLNQHAQVMKSNHQGWTDKQARCCLYWQNSVKSKLKLSCKEFVSTHPGCIYTLIPEAMGVNVFRTAHRFKIMIRKNPSMVYKVALVGYALKNEVSQLSLFS